MDQDTAQQLFENGGTFVFLDVPVGTEFGIDCQSWTIGPKFKGVKMIPPGLHFIYYSARNEISQQTAPRIGFFHNFHQGDLLIKKWDKQSEAISLASITDEERERITESKMELDRFLGSYPYDSYKKWVSLTDNLSVALASRLQPELGVVYSASQLISLSSTTQSRQAARDAAEVNMSCDDDDSGSKTNMLHATDPQLAGLPEMATVPGSDIRFTHIPKQKHPPGASPAEISKHNMDYSYLLGSMLENNYGGQYANLLGEIQFSFVCFLVGMVYDAFDQWKRLVHLVCSCQDAVSEHQELFDKLIGVLHFQLREVPEDFFVDIISRNNFLTTTLADFFANVAECQGAELLKEKALRFKAHLERKFNWDFTEMDDDDEPVVVP